METDFLYGYFESNSYPVASYLSTDITGTCAAALALNLLDDLSLFNSVGFTESPCAPSKKATE